MTPAPSQNPSVSARGAGAPGPLTGKLVLDLGRVIAAPYAAQTLADLGADVIKVERPGTGDDARNYPGPCIPHDPAAAAGAKGPVRGDAPHFVSANRNKQSICVDIANPQGQDLVRRLAAQADVLIENYKAGTLERYGLGWEALHALNPRLVYCSVTGFGQDGPYADRGGFDPIFQAMSGLMSVTGIPEGEPGAGPVTVGIVVEDVVTGKDAAMAILAALYERDTRSGLGQYLDIALLDASVALMSHAAQSYLISGKPLNREPGGGVKAGISGILPCADGAVYYVASRDPYFRALTAVLGQPSLADDPRFSSGPARHTHKTELLPLLNAAAQSWHMAALADALSAAGVPSGPMYSLDQTFADPQVRHRNLSVPLAHPRKPDLQVIASPLRLSRTPVRYELPPPILGQHTDEVLGGRLGLGSGEIAALRAAGAVA